MAVSKSTVQRFRPKWGPSLPEGWRYVRFGDVLRVARRPFSISDDQLYRQPVIRRNHGGIELRDEQLGSKILTKAQFLIRGGDWLMSKVQILHRAYGIVPEYLDGAVASGSYYAFEPTKELHLPFLWYLSQHPAFHASCELSSVGVVIEKMVFRVEDWLEFEMPLPPLQVQRRIAEILTSVDEAITATKAVIEQTRRVKQAMQETLLSRGTWGKDNSLSASHWPLVSLDQVSKRGSGHTPNKLVPEYWNGGVKWVSLQDSSALDKLYIHDTVVHISEAGIKGSSAVLHPKGTVVLSRDAGVGKSAIVMDDMAVSQHFMAWTCGPLLDPHYLYYWLQHMKPVFERVAIGSTIKTIGMPFFRRLEIPLPGIEEQRSISTVLVAHDMAIQETIVELNQLTLFKSGIAAALLRH